jgi:hypothetical protein
VHNNINFSIYRIEAEAEKEEEEEDTEAKLFKGFHLETATWHVWKA